MVFLWSCFSGGVFVVMFLWWCFVVWCSTGVVPSGALVVVFFWWCGVVLE